VCISASGKGGTSNFMEIYCTPVAVYGDELALQFNPSRTQVWDYYVN